MELSPEIEAYKRVFDQMMEKLALPENADIRAELSDPKYKKYTHGTRSTYARDCRGPLCRKSERDRSARRHEIIQASRGRKVRRYAPQAERERDEFLTWIIGWHRGSRASNPENKARGRISLDFDHTYGRVPVKWPAR